MLNIFKNLFKNKSSNVNVIDNSEDVVIQLKEELNLVYQKLEKCKIDLQELIDERAQLEKDKQESIRKYEEEKIRKEKEYELKRLQFEQILSKPENVEIVNLLSKFGFEFKHEPTVMTLNTGDIRFDFDFITGRISKVNGLTTISKNIGEGGPERIELIHQFLNKHLL